MVWLGVELPRVEAASCRDGRDVRYFADDNAPSTISNRRGEGGGEVGCVVVWLRATDAFFSNLFDPFLPKAREAKYRQ